jgi:hypothetical protein
VVRDEAFNQRQLRPFDSASQAAHQEPDLTFRPANAGGDFGAEDRVFGFQQLKLSFFGILR